MRRYAINPSSWSTRCKATTRLRPFGRRYRSASRSIAGTFRRQRDYVRMDVDTDQSAGATEPQCMRQLDCTLQSADTPSRSRNPEQALGPTTRLHPSGCRYQMPMLPMTPTLVATTRLHPEGCRYLGAPSRATARTWRQRDCTLKGADTRCRPVPGRCVPERDNETAP